MKEKKIRLDCMTIEQVKKLYNSMFENLIEKDLLDKIFNNYLEKYNEMKKAEQAGYSVLGGMGRGFKYLKNMLYGWYIEDLIFHLIKQNPTVKIIEFTGNDSNHNFIYNIQEKTITVEGNKTTNPDFLVTLNNNIKFYLELKTAAANVFSIKIGNVKKIQKIMGFTDIYSMIIMIDLVHQKYEIKGLSYFMDSLTFINNRMEGQICYEFPLPQKQFSLLKNENFELYIDNSIFETEAVKKYKALKIATKINDKAKIKEINNKISLEKLENEFKIQKEQYEMKYNKLISKIPNLQSKTWDEILADLEL